MPRISDYDAEDNVIPYRKAKHKSLTRRKPQEKASYEANPDVQRWLKEQSLGSDRAKPPFNPTLPISRHEGPWLRSALDHFYEENLITDVLHVVKSGKEATVYCCVADPSTGMDFLAAKIYRPRMFRSLKNDVVYRQNRTQYDEQGRVVRSARQQRGAIRKSEWSRAAQVSSWIEYEFQTQVVLYNSGADVPRPITQSGNSVLMDYVGDVEESAPLLREVKLEREEAPVLFACVMRNIELALSLDRIHGDLSAYNILYWQGGVKIIDFAQAVEPHYNPQMFSLLARDIERVCSYFASYGVEADASVLALDLWERYMDAAL